MQSSSMKQAGPVLLYDGECGLCTALAGWVLRRDAGGRLRVAALQGVTGQGLLRALALPTEDFDTLVFVRDRARPDSGHALRSDGVLAVLVVLGGFWAGVAAVLRLVPRAWRDVGYGWVARVRRRLFGGPRPLRLGAEDQSRVLP